MIIRILGSAAGGGFPQLNCACRLCAAVRAGAAGFRVRTQASVAVSATGQRWALLNASPDLRAQFAAAPALQPRPETGARHSPLGAVVLTNGDVDAIAGLLSLREGIAFDLLAAQPVLEALAANTVFKVLAPDVVTRKALPIGRPMPLVESLTVEASWGRYERETVEPEAGEGDGAAKARRVWQRSPMSAPVRVK